MGVAITCVNGNGFHIGRILYGTVSKINRKNASLRLDIERRDYPKQKKEIDWSSKNFGETIDVRQVLTAEDSPVLDGIEILFAKFNDHKPDAEKITLDITAKKEWPVTRFLWKDVRDPWRPAFDEDGIYQSDFLGKVKELSVQTLSDKTLLAYALVTNHYSRKEIAYLLIDEHPIKGLENDYGIIARIENGKIVNPRKRGRRGNEIDHDGALDYISGIETAQDSIEALAKRPDVIKGFWSIPTNYEKHRPMSKTLKWILDTYVTKPDPHIT